MKNIATRMKTLRLALNLSQDKLAENLNITKQAISNIENSKTMPSISLLCKLLVDYNVNLNFIVGGEGSMFLEDENSIIKLRSSIIKEVEKMLDNRGIG